jgi:hypothetical protein
MENVDLLLGTLLFPSLSEDGDVSEVAEHPMAKFFENAELDNALNKRVPTRDASWDEVITAPRVELSKEFLDRSDARFQRVAAKIRTMFGEHGELADEAVSIAKSMLHAERAAMIAS